MTMNYEQNIFVPPTIEERTEALGETDKLNDDIRRALTVGIDDSFPPIPIPNEGDWLNTHHETGQTVKQFKRCRKMRPLASSNIIYFQPIGHFNNLRSPSLDIICEFCHLFFPGCETKILSSINIDSTMENRINPITNQLQYLIPNLIEHLKKLQRKQYYNRHLFSIGVTMVDIYPGPEWNFVYGQASPDDAIGIYSFARFDPLFPHSLSSTLQKACTTEEQLLILKRAVSTCIHEIMHLFGLKHCIYYLCLMNGANSEIESDRQLISLSNMFKKNLFIIWKTTF